MNCCHIKCLELAAAGMFSIVVMISAGVFFFEVVVALEVGTKSKASQLFAESIEVVLGDCTFKQ